MKKTKHKTATTINSIRESQLGLYNALINKKKKKIRKTSTALFNETIDYIDSNLSFQTDEERSEIVTILYSFWNKEVFDETTENKDESV